MPRKFRDKTVEREGHYLREWRVRRGMTQDDVAPLMGVTQAQISRWEKGTNRASLDVVRKLADIYKVTPADLIAVGPDDEMAIDAMCAALKSAPPIQRDMILRAVKGMLSAEINDATDVAPIAGGGA